VTDFKEIVSFLESKFGLTVESEITANLMMLKVNGLDNASIRRYIENEFDDISVYCQEKEGYKFHNTWIKIEKKQNVNMVT